MKITDKTLYADLLCIEKYIPDAEREKLIQFAQQRYKEYYNLTISEFFALLDKDYSLIEYFGNSEELTALQYFFYARLHRFRGGTSDYLRKTHSQAIF